MFCSKKKGVYSFTLHQANAMVTPAHIVPEWVLFLS